MASDARTGLPIGEEKLGGVDKVIDAVGFQAHDHAHPDRERPDQVTVDAARLLNPAGALAIAGVYPERDTDPNPVPLPTDASPCPGEHSSAKASRHGSAAATTAATPRTYAT
jgi:threonine dehydrogenase-like Zn-dependent dehydrogenase